MKKKKERIQKTGWGGLCKLGGGCGADRTRLAKEGNETELLGRLIKNVTGLCFLFRVRSALTGTP